MNTENKEYGWEEPPIDNPNEGDFVLLPDGEYPFTVTTFERERFAGSAKLPACNMAVIHLLVDSGPAGQVTIKHRLYLHSKCQGLIAQFFKGVGLRKKGEQLVMNWSALAGCTGRVKLGKRADKNDPTKFWQDVKGFADSTAQPAQSPTPPASDDMPF